MAKPKTNEAKQDFLKRCTQGKIADGGLTSDAAFKACNLEWDNAKGQRAALALSLPIEFFAAADTGPDAVDGGAGFEIVAYTGKVMPTWFGDVVIDVSGIQTKDKIPVLREHERDRVVGFGRTSKDKSNLYVGGEFSQITSDAIEVRQLADEGYPWQASVAVMANSVEILKDDKATAKVNGQEFNGPLEIWRQSRVGEVSFVTLGRDDDTAGISLTANDDRYPVTIETSRPITNNITITKEAELMEYTMDLLMAEAPELVAAIKDDVRQEAFNQGYEDGSAAERARVSEILAAGADAEIALAAINDGVSAEAAYKLFYEAEVAKRGAGLTELAENATPAVEVPQPTDEGEPKSPEQVRAAWQPKMGPAAKAA